MRHALACFAFLAGVAASAAGPCLAGVAVSRGASGETPSSASAEPRATVDTLTIGRELQATVSADSTPAPSRRPGFRIVPRPLPECTSFPIVEVGLMKPLGTSEVTRGDGERALILDYGLMKNVNPRSAWGGVVHAEFGSFRSRFGLAARRRTWLSRAQAFDLQAGVLLGGKEKSPYAFAPPGFLLGAKLSLGDVIVLDLHTETHSIKEELEANTRAYGPIRRAPVTHASLQVGSVVGSIATAAVIGFAIAVVGAIYQFGS